MQGILCRLCVSLPQVLQVALCLSPSQLSERERARDTLATSSLRLPRTTAEGCAPKFGLAPFATCAPQWPSMAPKKERTEKENVSLGPSTREGENVFGVCHIFASFNDSEWLRAAQLRLQLLCELIGVDHQRGVGPQLCEGLQFDI